MAYHSQTLGRSLTVTSLEGVQFRLGDRFKPPEKVGLPPTYKEFDLSATLEATQYSFETETSFLKWFETKKLSDAARAAEKKQAQEKQEAVPESTTTAGSPVLGNTNNILQPTNVKNAPSEPKNHFLPPKMGSNILMPVLMATNSGQRPVSMVTSASLGDRNSTFDLADFENNASDPFESTELETLDDLEELKNVLACTTIVAQSVSVTREQPLHSPDHSFEENSTKDDAAEVNIEVTNKQVAYQANKLKPIPMPRGVTPVDSGPSQNVPSSQPVLTVINSGVIERTPLPPIKKEPIQQETIPPPQECVTGSGVQPIRGRSPPPGYYAPSCASSTSPIDSPPSYPQSVSLSAIDSVQLPDLDMENLNHYTPLPPFPHRYLEDCNRVAPVDHIYESLNSEDKHFVSTITSMGFPQPRTARAVKQFGHDDRLVVEWLCSVDHLCSKGFSEDKVEVALSLQDNKTEKAMEFLLLCQRFEELGFKSEDVRRELIVHGNNEDTVLNILTAKS